MPPPLPETGDDLSHASLSFCGEGHLTLWSDPAMTQTLRGPTPSVETLVDLKPGRPVVVGRQQGGETPYLDPAYQPTPIVPGLSRPVVGGSERDLCVSRGHFLLATAPGGLRLVNGVPRRGGGIRPPLNGTILLEPEHRDMHDAEEYLIPHGGHVRIQLPNGTQVVIRAE